MGLAPCCGDHEGLKRGPWTAEEDQKLIHYVQSHGLGNWRTLPKLARLSRCGKICRLRWANYLRPDIKRGPFSMHEDLTIIRLHAVLGNKWSVIASNLPGRTDNEVKNHWNAKLKKRLLLMGIDPVTHMSLPTPDMLSCLMTSSSTAIAAPLNNALAEAQLGQLVRDCVNITGSGDEYSWQLSPILHLLAMHNNPLWTHPSESLTSVVPIDLSTLDWNSMPNLVPSSIPDHKNDHRYRYVSNKKSSSISISSSYKGGSEIPENTIHYDRDDTFGSAIRTAHTMSLPPRENLEEDESSYWLRLLNSIDDSNGDPTNYIKLHFPSPNYMIVIICI